MDIDVIRPPRAVVEACISRYRELAWSDGHEFEDAQLPEGEQRIAFPLRQRAEYGAVFCACRPGHGAASHAHDVHETLIVMSGRWRIGWEDASGPAEAVLGPLDMITAPPGLEVSFKNEEPGEGATAGVMLSIIGSPDPGIQYSEAVAARMRDLGIAPSG